MPSCALARALGRAALFSALVLAAPRPAAAFAHLWDFTELYSDASGEIQFIEMWTPGPSEYLLVLSQLRSAASNSLGRDDFSFPSNLVPPTTHKHMLLGTAGFAALPGVPSPDFILPAGFLGIAGGDRLTLIPAGDPATAYDSFAYGAYGSAAPELPTSGFLSLQRAQRGELEAPGPISVAPWSPTNFAGQAIPEPAPALLLGLGLSLLAAVRRHQQRS